MEAQTAQPPSSSAAYPRWVFLERRCKSKVDDDGGSSCPPPAAAETLAAALTSSGHPIQVSFALQHPPAMSAVRVNLPDGVHPKYCLAVAAHGGALLIVLKIERDFDDADAECTLGSELTSRWTTTAVFPVGDATLCWVDLSHGGAAGVLFCDAPELETAECPRLRYVPLPTVPSPCCGRNVCATAAAGDGSGGGAIKFVNVYPRCCCGGAGASDCPRSRHAYTVNTWTLRMAAGMEMEWVMDAMAIDATELWSQDMYKGLPRVPLGYPVVSLYEPHVVCFVVCEGHHVKFKHGGGDETIWLLMVDMRSKTIRSVSRHPYYWFSGRDIITTNVSYYLNPHGTTCGGDGGDDGTSTGGGSHTGEMGIEKKKREDNNVTNSMLLQSPCKAAADEPAAAPSDEILAVLREIPSYGLAHDDMLKAFLVLSGDDKSCQVRSLLRVPKNLRKDWLLKKIKEDR